MIIEVMVNNKWYQFTYLGLVHESGISKVAYPSLDNDFFILGNEKKN